MAEVQSQNFPQSPSTEGGEPRLGHDTRSKTDQEADAKLAERLSVMIESANERVVPLTKMIRTHIEAFEHKSPEDRDEDQLIKEVRPLLEQAEKVLNETNARRSAASLSTTLLPKQRLAQALKVMIEEVQGTIDWAKGKLENYPKAKKNLGPLLAALGQPLTQIVGGVGLLLAGVLNLVGNLLSGLGLDGLLKGILAATGLKQICKGLGLDKWFGTQTGLN
ncbi:hypothetical protein BKA70DRAFT_1417390 [Coprinopsis sp. MPI-PUGE-AT-0042]|nr:hypothetical protein BKA70DRAFT_1417390 [Coprinopsis sp. MPI-PUGE-AT-0042]